MLTLKEFRASRIESDDVEADAGCPSGDGPMKGYVYAGMAWIAIDDDAYWFILENTIQMRPRTDADLAYLEEFLYHEFYCYAVD